MSIADAERHTTPPPVWARYDNVAIALHWLIALGIVLNIALGLYMGTLEPGPTMFSIIVFHKAVGLTVLWLSVLRVLWRLFHPLLPLPAGMSLPLKFIARTTHGLLYLLMLALPLTGWAMSSASPRAGTISYFGLFDWPRIGWLMNQPMDARKSLAHSFGEAHETLAWIMIALVVIHVGGALYHQFVRRDSVLSRMIPSG